MLSKKRRKPDRLKRRIEGMKRSYIKSVKVPSITPYEGDTHNPYGHFVRPTKSAKKTARLSWLLV